MLTDFDMHPGPGGVVLVATNPAAAALAKSLRTLSFTGAILLVEDSERRQPALPSGVVTERISIKASEIGSLMSTVRDMHAPLGCTMGWHGVFPRAFVEAFDSRLLNVHTGDLPRYRGAGGGSWQVLNGETHVIAHVQQMRVGLDRGPLIHGTTELLPERPYPADVKAASHRAVERVAEWLARAIVEGRRVPLQTQDESAATYFPRLDSSVDGWLNFSWPFEPFERFVRAFSDPYPGAAFRYRDSTFRTSQARLRDGSERLHPFCHGLIVNRTDTALHVAIPGGIVCLESITDQEGQLVDLRIFGVGTRLHGGAPRESQNG